MGYIVHVYSTGYVVYTPEMEGALVEDEREL